MAQSQDKKIDEATNTTPTREIKTEVAQAPTTLETKDFDPIAAGRETAKRNIAAEKAENEANLKAIKDKTSKQARKTK